jgi:hypothetical protein
MSEIIFIGNPFLFPTVPFTPTGAALWYNAGDPSTLAIIGGAASQLNDKSGNNRHLTQTNATQRPIVTANGLNGLSILTFDGVDDFMSNGSAGLPTDISIIVLMKYNSSSGQDVALGHGITGQTRGIRAMYRGTGSTTQGFATFSNDITSSSLSCDIGGDFHIFSIVQSGQQVSMWRDGTPDSVLPRTLPLSPNTVTTPNFTIGSLLGAAIATYYTHMSFCELVIYHSAISTGLRQQTEGFIAHGWDMQSSLVSHPYTVTPP